MPQVVVIFAGINDIHTQVLWKLKYINVHEISQNNGINVLIISFTCYRFSHVSPNETFPKKVYWNSTDTKVAEKISGIIILQWLHLKEVLKPEYFLTMT